MNRLLNYLKEYKWECILGPAFKLLEACFELSIPLVVKKIIDYGVAEKDKGTVIGLGILMIVLALIGCACAVSAQFFAARAAVNVGTDFRQDMFAHINRLSYTEIDTLGTSMLINRMTTDINQVQNAVNMVLRLFLRSPFIVMGALIMAFSINGMVGVIFLLTIPILAFIVFGLMRLTVPLHKDAQKQLDDVVLKTRENLVGARVIRAFSRQRDEEDAFVASTSALEKIQLKAGSLSALMNPLTLAIVNIGIVGILYQGGVQINRGYLTQGDVVALVNYMSQILVELIKLANLIVLITKALACLNRLDEVMDVKPSVVEEHQFTIAKVPGAPKVEFQNVSITYKGSTEPSLKDINFKVEPGETVGIIGATGSGKSSLIRLIPRFYDVSAGKVLVDGKDVRDYSFGQLRGKIGYVPQKAVLFKGTIKDNMMWGNRAATDRDIWYALEVAQARDFVEKKPFKLNTEVLQGGMNYSGGQRQRLTIARSLVRKPEILILDDSASALDYATEARLRDALHEMSGTMTTFIVSQRASSIRLADKIIVLEDGEICGIGRHEELYETCKTYREICDTQMASAGPEYGEEDDSDGE